MHCNQMIKLNREKAFYTIHCITFISVLLMSQSDHFNSYIVIISYCLFKKFKFIFTTAKCNDIRNNV
uniref:Uncharacterized protein n=1 Tax=Anguilla anguilla TaxID=7936 RepID=A0A0E9XDA9_ANGAN